MKDSIQIRRVNFGQSETPMFEEHLEFNTVIPHSVRRKIFLSDETVPLHYADTLEILICENLVGEIVIDQYHYFDLEKAVFVIPPKTIHSTNIKRCSGTQYIIKIPFEALSYYVDILHILDFEGFDILELPHRCKCFQILKEIAENLIRDDSNIFARMRHIISIFESLVKSEHVDCKESAIKKYDVASIDLHRMINWTRDNYKKKITLEDASKEAGFSKYYFCNQFKKMTGMTFLSYLNQVRVTQAKLLLNLKASITFIAYECGFESPSYFSMVFKKSTGVTPREYRQLCRTKK